MLILMLSIALAQDTPSAPVAPGEELKSLGDTVSTTTVEVDTYSFPLTSCDRVRAFYDGDAPTSSAEGNLRSPLVSVVLENQTGTTCLYKGVALKGFLAGMYRTSQGNPDGSFYLSPGKRIVLHITPADPTLPRGAVQMQIPPGTGLVILDGKAPGAATGPR